MKCQNANNFNIVYFKSKTFIKMGSVDLIARENEFKKLNKQLEKKTESLMKEIEEVMRKPDIFATPNLKLISYNNKTSARKHCCVLSPSSENCAQTNDLVNTKSKDRWKKDCTYTNRITLGVKDAKEQNLNKHITLTNCTSDVEKLVSLHNCNSNSPDACNAQRVVCDCCVNEKITDEMEFLYAFVSVNVKDNILPQSYLKGKVTVESVCKCLSAKIKLMQEQLERLQNTIEKKNKQCEAHLTHIAELESERFTLLNTANTMKSETADMKAKYLAIQSRLNEKDRLYKEQRSTTDKLTVEVKQYRCRNNGLEARCASQEEAMAGLRQQLEAAKLAEKEYRTSTRSLSSSHETTIKRLECQLTALRTRLSQQRALIANLRAQRTLLSAERAVHSLSAQYCRLLEDGD